MDLQISYNYDSKCDKHKCKCLISEFKKKSKNTHKHTQCHKKVPEHKWPTYVPNGMETVLGTTGTVKIQQVSSFNDISCHPLTSSSDVIMLQCNVTSQYMRQLCPLRYASGLLKFSSSTQDGTPAGQAHKLGTTFQTPTSRRKKEVHLFSFCTML